MKLAPPKPEVNIFVFLSSALTLLFCAFLTFFFPQKTAFFLNNVQNIISTNLSWYYILLIVISLIFVVWLSLSPYGQIKLGQKDDKPAFSYLAWISMLFSAGIGVALIYYGAFEPLEHFFHPPVGTGETATAAQNAMVLTFFHWGIHGWALYALMAVIFAYYHYVEQRPLNLRSALHPILKDRIHGPLGQIVDAFGILATIMAMVSNLGIGALLVQGGLSRIFNIPESHILLIFVIIGMSILASLIAIMRIEKGIARLSEINVILLCALLIFVFLFSSKAHILDALVQNIGDYLNHFIKLSFELYIYQNAQEWRGLWTIFFWAWWIAWAPFVSLFIARISKGRTIRELIFGVMFVPLAFTLLWLGIFGNAALDLYFLQNIKTFGTTILADSQDAIFSFLAYYPLPTLTLWLATIMSCILCFTPVDSGCVMIANLSTKTQNEEQESPKWLRIFWCALTCLITIGLFMAHNFLAIQTAIVLCGFPFSIILILYIISFSKSLKHRSKSKL